MSDSHHPTKNRTSAKFSVSPTGEKTLSFNVISKSMNFSFAQNKGFLGKLTKIRITFVYLLFSNMLTFSSMLQNLRGDLEMWDCVMWDHSLSDSHHPTKNRTSAKFSVSPTGEKTLSFNVISKSMNFSFAQNKGFLGKLTKIRITFVYLLFSNMLTFSSMLQNLRGDLEMWDCVILGQTASKFLTCHKKGHFLGNYIQLFLV